MEKGYFSLFEVLKSLNAYGDRLVHISKGKGTIPCFWDCKFHCSKVGIGILELSYEGNRVRVHLLDAEFDARHFRNSLIGR